MGFFFFKALTSSFMEHKNTWQIVPDYLFIVLPSPGLFLKLMFSQLCNHGGVFL